MKESENFISIAIREFQRLKKLSDDAVSQISKEQFFLRESDRDNSIAVVYKHVAGNLISRWTDFLTSDGEKPDRNRDTEFMIFESDSYDSLTESWEKGWRVLFDSLHELSPSDISRSVTIRGENLCVLQAISRQMTHYAYHVGQIVYLAKHHAGDKWVSLSIPVGKSAERVSKKYRPSCRRADFRSNCGLGGEVPSLATLEEHGDETYPAKHGVARRAKT